MVIWMLYIIRVTALVVLHPILAYHYFRAQWIERLFDPSAFLEALLERLGWGAEQYGYLEPSRPKDIALVVYTLWHSA